MFLGARSMGFGRAKTAGPPAVIFDGLSVLSGSMRVILQDSAAT
jgi:hypothetical protein